MELRPFTIKSHCVANDETLYRNITYALSLNLPVISQHFEHDGTAIFVGSGPSVLDHLNDIKEHRRKNNPIIAIKDAHDWLIEEGVIPDYALAVDPQENRFDCFKLKNGFTKYFIASQCHAVMFDHLKDCKVFLWHLYVRKNQSIPPHGTPLIGGGTTTGLRSITLFYTLGYRKIELYGFDSCLKDGVLRMNGDRPHEETVNEIVVNGKMFYCNPGMTAQASEFQNLFQTMPDLKINSYGDGLITEIIKARKDLKPLSISFIHDGGEMMASYRYRAKIPSSYLENSSLNNYDSDVLIFSKPSLNEISNLKIAIASGKKIIVDFCDDHFIKYPFYKKMAFLADSITVPTAIMRDIVYEHCRRIATVIPDPYEFDQLPPHCNGTKLLWFGHALNYYSLERILPELTEYSLQIISNKAGAEPWSIENMQRAFALCDIVIIPKTADYKSPNRAIEAIRQGCFVVAEPHPSLNNFPGIWIGNIKEGIEWTIQNKQQANQNLLEAQLFVEERFSPRTVAYAWSQIIMERNCILEAETVTGTDG